jgi:hypothetical protein
VARPRSVARPISKAVFDPPSGCGPLPLPLRELLESEDPALGSITKQVLVAKLAGRDVTDPAVLADCIRVGRADYASALLDGVA